MSLLFLAAALVTLHSSPDEIMIKNCVVTPTIWEETTTDFVYHTNNLRLRVGSAEYATGQFIQIVGRVFDSRCVPVQGAIVEISHLDAHGCSATQTKNNYFNENWLYIDRGVSIKGKYRCNSIDPHFIGSGMVVTDNMGQYAFYTIMPGSNFGPPKIRFSVSHKDFPTLKTQMYFPEFDNAEDPLIKKLSALQLEAVVATQAPDSGDETIYNYNITLLGKQRGKGY